MSISTELATVLKENGARKVSLTMYEGWSHTDAILEGPFCGDDRLFHDMCRAINKHTSSFLPTPEQTDTGRYEYFNTDDTSSRTSDASISDSEGEGGIDVDGEEGGEVSYGTGGGLHMPNESMSDAGLTNRRNVTTKVGGLEPPAVEGTTGAAVVVDGRKKEQTNKQQKPSRAPIEVHSEVQERQKKQGNEERQEKEERLRKVSMRPVPQLIVQLARRANPF
jgi:hypothetical protein